MGGGIYFQRSSGKERRTDIPLGGHEIRESPNQGPVKKLESLKTEKGKTLWCRPSENVVKSPTNRKNQK